jgi:hypothetical protein
MHPRAATCPAPPDPASQPRWAPELSRDKRLWDPPLNQGGLQRGHVYCGSGPMGRASEHHVFYGSRSCLLLGALRAVMRLVVPCGP